MNEFELFFKLGWQHILSLSSWDHILFLISLVIVFELKEFKKIFVLISLFTLAHTTSLLLSAYHFIKVNEQIIETLIIYTIFITSLSNIILKEKKLLHQLHYYFSFFFGLIHGLGFATDFKMMVAGNSKIFFPVLEFTLGIESTQILFAIILLVLIKLLNQFIGWNAKEIIKVLSAIIVGYTLAHL